MIEQRDFKLDTKPLIGSTVATGLSNVHAFELVARTYVHMTVMLAPDTHSSQNECGDPQSAAAATYATSKV